MIVTMGILRVSFATMTKSSRFLVPFLNLGHLLDHLVMLVFPTVVIAGSRTGLRTGGFVDLPGGNEIHGRMLLSIARASGAELTRFGTHVEPWPELFA